MSIKQCSILGRTLEGKGIVLKQPNNSTVVIFFKKMVYEIIPVLIVIKNFPVLYASYDYML